MSNTSGVVTLESWLLFALGVCLIAARIISRRFTLGAFSNLQCDDWLMLLAVIPFIGVIICANEVYNRSVDSSRTADNETLRLKFKFALEEAQLLATWLVKACLLILYRRIFPNGKERSVLTWITLYCLGAFLAIQILLPLWCTPVQQYWSISPKNEQCSTYHSHAITSLALDVTTTLAVFIFPIPFIPTPRKFLLILLFILGVLVLILSALGRYYLLVFPPTSTTYLLLYCAEAAAAIYFANLPFLSSLVTSNSTARLRQVSSRFSLSHWPRSVRASPHFPIETANSSAPSRCGSPIDVEDAWSESNITSVTPMASVLSRRPTDPPPELEDFLSSTRPSTRGTDLDIENLSRRPSTRGTEGDTSSSRRPSVRTVEAGDWSRRPSVRTAETADWSRRQSLKSAPITPNQSRRASLKGLESPLPSRLPSLRDTDFEEWTLQQAAMQNMDIEERRSSSTSWYHAS